MQKNKKKREDIVYNRYFFVFFVRVKYKRRSY